MDAPALIVLAHGSRDERSVTTIHAIAEMTGARAAFLDLAAPSLDDAVDQLVGEGHPEIVVVPLLLTDAYHANHDVPAVVTAAEARHPGVRVRVTQTLGLDNAVFTVLDRRLREATVDCDGVVLAAAGSSNPEVNAAVARAATAWGARRGLPTVAAFASQAPPAAGEAVRMLRDVGCEHIAVGLLFIAPGVLTDRVEELALESGAEVVSKPLGAAPEIAELIRARSTPFRVLAGIPPKSPCD